MQYFPRCARLRSFLQFEQSFNESNSWPIVQSAQPFLCKSAPSIQCLIHFYVVKQQSHKTQDEHQQQNKTNTFFFNIYELYSYQNKSPSIYGLIDILKLLPFSGHLFVPPSPLGANGGKRLTLPGGQIFDIFILIY